MRKKFTGFLFPERNYYSFPKDLNGYMSQLSGNEFKVLAYIVRKTWGFNKLEDKISFSQFLQGVQNKDGVIIFDKLGIGERTLERCLNALDKKGFIEIIKETGKTNTYKLKYSTTLNLAVDDHRQFDAGTTANLADTINVNNNNNVNNTNNTSTNVEVAKQSFAGKEVNHLIPLFKEVNPSYERFFGNKSERSALERLVEKHGVDKMRWTIKILVKTNTMPYAPRITKPTQLEDKLGGLIAFLNVEKKKVMDRKIVRI